MNFGRSSSDFVRFASLTLGIAMVAAAVVALAFSSVWVMLACAVVASWSINVFIDALRYEQRELNEKEDLRRREGPQEVFSSDEEA